MSAAESIRTNADVFLEAQVATSAANLAAARAMMIVPLSVGALGGAVIGIVLGLTLLPLVFAPLFVIVGAALLAGIARRSVTERVLDAAGARPCAAGDHPRVTNIMEGLSPSIGVFAAAMVPVLVCLNSLNSFGIDGPALWVDIATAGSLEPVLSGKNRAQMALTIAVSVPVATVLAAVEHGWGQLGPTLALAVCAAGTVSGIGNIASVVAPVAIPDSPRNAFATAGGGKGCVTALVQVAAVAGVGIAGIVPVVVTVAGSHLGPLGALAAAGAVIAYGLGARRAGISLALRYVTGREPELLAAIAPRQAE